jgi:hypothetical protein
MADLTVTAARLRPIEGIEKRTKTLIAGVAITKGQLVRQNASGQFVLADASAAGTLLGLVGIATSDAPAGTAVDTAGAVSNTAGTVSTKIGTVFVLTDPAATRYIHIDIQL